MPREEERMLRLRQQRSKEAIDLAMQGRWAEAVAVNQEIIEQSPADVEAYNRLGRAYREMGEYARARQAYLKSQELDPFNVIAARNLRRLKDVKLEAISGAGADRVEPQQFIEEIGKAGVVNIIDLAPKEVRATMAGGNKLNLRPEGSGLIVENSRGEYIGRIEPKHAQRLVRLMQGGNRYAAALVTSYQDSMTAIIRETYQDPGQLGKVSFPPRGVEEVRPFVGDKLVSRDAEDEEDAEDESGYTIIGGDEVEVLPEESEDSDDDTDDDEE